MDSDIVGCNMGKNFEELEDGCWYLARNGEVFRVRRKKEEDTVCPFEAGGWNFTRSGIFAPWYEENRFDLVEKVEVTIKRKVKKVEKVRKGEAIYYALSGELHYSASFCSKEEFCARYPDRIFVTLVEDTIEEVEVETEVEEEVKL